MQAIPSLVVSTFASKSLMALQVTIERAKMGLVPVHMVGAALLRLSAQVAEKDIVTSSRSP